MHCKHRTILLISGSIWLLMGVFLLTMGLRFLTMVSFNNENMIILMITMGLLIGFLKGRFILGKSATREIKRVTSLPNPTSIKNLFSKRYYLLVIIMMGLGMALRFVPVGVRGFIDIAVGAGLINGSRFYFRHLLSSLISKEKI